jgi:hypothetical protein
MMGRTLPALALLAGLLFPSSPGDFASAFVRAWISLAGPQAHAKNGPIIDPNGKPGEDGMGDPDGATTPGSIPGENGMTIDPDG